MIKCKGSQTKNVQLVDYVYNACKNDEKKRTNAVIDVRCFNDAFL
jgi:hypothetical protein